jgi:chaperonin cofactor prefoldin
MIKQGDITNAKRVDALEKRVEMLENMLKALQSKERPKIGRPVKVKDELKSDTSSRD